MLFSRTLLFFTTLFIITARLRQIFGLTLVSSRRPFFRKDYTYFEQFDSFYKLHWDDNGISWDKAFMACDGEGASIFYPETEAEWSIVKPLVSSMRIKPNRTDVLIGIHDEFGLGEFMTIDGLTTPVPLLDKDEPAQTGQDLCVTKDIDSGSYKVDSCDSENTKPFVCKKKVVLDSCPTIDEGYTYVRSLKKCYKLNIRKKTWSDALHTCFMEGSILAVIKNSDEAGVISRLIGENYNTQHFVGFREQFETDNYYTVKGQKLDDTFYINWVNNIEYEQTLQIEPLGTCGVVLEPQNRNTLQMGTRNCNRPAPFVCEMSVEN